MAGGCGSEGARGPVARTPNASPMPLTPTTTQASTEEAVATSLPTAAPQAATVETHASTVQMEAPMAPATASVSPALSGVLLARPVPPAQAAAGSPGVQPLGLLPERDALLFVPAGYTSSKPATLVLLLHGAGGIAEHGLSLLQGLANEANLLLLAPSSRRQTWDMIHDEYGPDVAHIDEALARVFSRYAVDSARLAVGGFSDGASYALSLGLINGDLFTHIIAFSPGYMAPSRQAGMPRIFISHGTRDEVLPIDRCSRRIVPRLEQARYDVRYREFDGPHTVPPEITREAVDWFTTP